jgi:hypothetical protein
MTVDRGGGGFAGGKQKSRLSSEKRQHSEELDQSKPNKS